MWATIPTKIVICFTGNVQQNMKPVQPTVVYTFKKIVLWQYNKACLVTTFGFFSKWNKYWEDLHDLSTFNSFMLGDFSCFCCCRLTLFKISFFKIILSGTWSECQTVWIQIRTDIMYVECSGSVVECLTLDGGFAGSSPTGSTVCDTLSSA